MYAAKGVAGHLLIMIWGFGWAVLCSWGEGTLFCTVPPKPEHPPTPGVWLPVPERGGGKLSGHLSSHS